MKRRIFLTVLALCLVLGFSALGRWQLGREQEKREQLAAADRALAAAPRALDQALGQGKGIDRVQGHGHFESGLKLLLDNQRRGDRVGLRLYCVFETDDSEVLLVDLGWLPLGGERVLPDPACPDGRLEVSGLLVPPPSVGLRMGPGLVAQPDGKRWLAMRVEPEEIGNAIGRRLASRVLRLDPDLPFGYERDLELLSNTLPPEKHRGYALQWFGLAFTTLVITVLLNLRRRP